MNILARFATAVDVDWCQSHDRLVPRDLLQRKISHREIVVVEIEEDRVGYLRLGFLWSTIPQIDLIWVDEQCRRQGVGRSLLELVEQHLRAQGHKILLSSAQADEPESQAWHRAVGFQECGFLAGINKHGIGEIFFSKPLP